MRRHALIVAAWSALASLNLCQHGRAEEGFPEPPPFPEVAATPSAAPLKRAPSAAYVPLRSETRVRSAPSSSAPVVSTLSAATKPLQALGMVVDQSAGTPSAGPGDPAPAQTWIKLRLPAGKSGYANLDDLVTPQQAEARASSMKKVGVFEAEVATAKRTKGPDMPSGIYTQGGSCDVPLSTEGDVGAFLQDKVLIWQDGSKMHFVRVLRPENPTVYDILSDNQVQELRGYGYVAMRTFRSSKDAALMGYKDRKLWVSADAQAFKSYEFCDPALADAVLSMLRSYADQRPPEGR